MVCGSSVSQPSTASKARQVKRGVKEVAKAIRKGEKGCVTRCRDGASLTETHEQTIGSRCRHHAN